MSARHIFVASLVVALAAGCAEGQSPHNVGTAATRAQAERVRVDLESAAERRDSVALKTALTTIEAAEAITPRDPWLLHYRGYGMYSLASMRMSQSQPTAVLADLIVADSLLEQSLNTLALPEGIALRASVAGLRAGADPGSAMTQGMKAGALMAQALATAPRNPRVLLLAGVSAMYTPEQYGGGVARARVLFQRADSAFAADTPATPAPRWGRNMLGYFMAQLAATSR
jgi:hypothetical protein